MRDLNDMIVFAKVAECGGFSAAAEHLALPKSNVSRRVSRLEEALGIRLLERTTRRVHLTEAGGLYLQHCRRISEEAEHADQSISELMERPRGLLRVSASVSTGQHLLSCCLAKFLDHFPEIQLELQLSNRHVDIIEEGFDVVVRIGRLEESSLISKRLGSSRTQFFASTKYLEMRGVPTDPADLAHHDCLMMSDRDVDNKWRLMGASGPKTISINPRAVVNDFATLREMAADGGGVAALPSYMGSNSEFSGKLEKVLADWSLPSVEFHALYPSRRGATPKLRAFLDFLGEELRKKLQTAR